MCAMWLRIVLFEDYERSCWDELVRKGYDSERYAISPRDFTGKVAAAPGGNPWRVGCMQCLKNCTESGNGCPGIMSVSSHGFKRKSEYVNDLTKEANISIFSAELISFGFLGGEYNIKTLCISTRTVSTILIKRAILVT